MARDFDGRRILVVEDSPVVAPFTRDILNELGCVAVGPATNLADARVLAETEEIDGAIVDVRIRGDKSFAICDILERRGIPFVLTSGYADWTLPDNLKDRPQLPKPYKLEDLEKALVQLIG